MNLLQEIEDDLFLQKKLKVLVLRLDLIHPLTGGNKYFKLKYNLQEAKALGISNVLSFGGAYSNHIAALAYEAKQNGLNSIGVIRGDELNEKSNPTLKIAKENGMQFYFVDREVYRLRNDPDFYVQLRKKFGEAFIIPEGGSNALAIKGCMEIKHQIDLPFDSIMAACGTGGTIAGIALSMDDHQKAIGIPVLKGAEFLQNEISRLQNEAIGKFNFSANAKIPSLIYDYHFGGYAKTTEELMDFKKKFESDTNIPLDKIYTCKLFYALYDLINKDHFEKNKTVVVVHSGGLQGN